MRLANESFDRTKGYGHSLVHLLRSAWFEFENDRARYFAVAMIYYALVSMIPIVLLLMAALGLLLRFSPVALVYVCVTVQILPADCDSLA